LKNLSKLIFINRLETTIQDYYSLCSIFDNDLIFIIHLFKIFNLSLPFGTYFVFSKTLFVFLLFWLTCQ
jgi:hypothetical protein